MDVFLGLFAPYFVRNSWEGSRDDEVSVGLAEMGLGCQILV